ncbi:MAG: ribosome biogenesis GTP-binding protein YsxC [Bdellovibrionaceae bacterium]|nr:ribosome biogenesis GTP-binding protein YsxC [Pseudobdellovibrionaceae bacterium]|tara:strand:+ start:2141 stop:2764 length:624 start_codon:yes stop_codon:yes gene_type:complete
MATKFIHQIARQEDIKQTVKGNYLLGLNDPRVAFVGRSNVGKSSIINALFNTKLARVSNEPGKTRAIYFYHYQPPFEQAYVVADLPGYGYAKVSQSERQRWAHFIQSYLNSDPLLKQVFLLWDGKVGPTEQDLQSLEFFLAQEKMIHIVMTKVDRIKNQKSRVQMEKKVAEILESYDCSDLPLYWTSSKTKKGLAEIKKFLRECPNE